MIVLDSSFVIARLTTDARRSFVREIMDASADDFRAPLLLSFEVVSVLSRKQRRSVLSLAERDAAVRVFDRLLITFDERPGADVLGRIATLAASERLSGYDATYLELAIRLGAELGTLDSELAEAGRRCGIVVHHLAPS